MYIATPKIINRILIEGEWCLTILIVVWVQNIRQMIAETKLKFEYSKVFKYPYLEYKSIFVFGQSWLNKIKEYINKIVYRIVIFVREIVIFFTPEKNIKYNPTENKLLISNSSRLDVNINSSIRLVAMSKIPRIENTKYF